MIRKLKKKVGVSKSVKVVRKVKAEGYLTRVKVVGQGGSFRPKDLTQAKAARSVSTRRFQSYATNRATSRLRRFQSGSCYCQLGSVRRKSRSSRLRSARPRSSQPRSSQPQEAPSQEAPDQEAPSQEAPDQEAPGREAPGQEASRQKKTTGQTEEASQASLPNVHGCRYGSRSSDAE